MNRLWAVALVMAAGAAASAGDIRITPLVADGHVSASFVAPEAFTGDSRDVVKSGVPVTLSFGGRPLSGGTGRSARRPWRRRSKSTH